MTGYDLDADTAKKLTEEKSVGHDVRVGADLKEFVGLLRRPKAVMLLVPAGHPVDAVIKDLVPLLDMQDLIIDCCDSGFVDVWASLSQF